MSNDKVTSIIQHYTIFRLVPDKIFKLYNVSYHYIILCQIVHIVKIENKCVEVMEYRGAKL